jgi:hypothetical protein
MSESMSPLSDAEKEMIARELHLNLKRRIVPLTLREVRELEAIADHFHRQQQEESPSLMQARREAEARRLEDARGLEDAPLTYSEGGHN